MNNVKDLFQLLLILSSSVQIVEIRPERVSQLGLGRRICVYWSSQLSYLHPSTVVGPDNDDEYILVQLDDGDSRDVHIEQVRFLPDSYPIVGRIICFSWETFLNLYSTIRFCPGSRTRAGVLRRTQGPGLHE